MAKDEKVSRHKGMVYLVGAGPGHPDLITVRGLECLKQAEVVVYDRLANHSLLAHARQAELIDVGKRPHHHRLPQAEITALLIDRAQQGKVVVRLKGGDPFVFGRGGEEALALVEAGLPFEIVPGITSAIAAPAYAGIPITHRGISCSVAIATGHRADSVNDPDCNWVRLAAGPDTLIFLMGVRNLPYIVEQLVAHGRSPDTPVALVEQASRTAQKTVVGTLADIVERASQIQAPAAIIVGEAVRLRESLRWFDLADRHPLLGLRVLNTRPLNRAAGLSRRLMDLGAEAVELPTTQIVPISTTGPVDTAIRRLASAAAGVTRSDPPWPWIFFTSANSVSFFIDRLLALGYDGRVLAGVKLLAIGRATAKTLLKYGLTADLAFTRYTVSDILAEVGDIGGQHILMPQGREAWPRPVSRSKSNLANTLRAQGAVVEAVTAYEILPVEPDPAAMSALLDGGVDVAVFISPSGVAGLVDMLDSQLLSNLLSPLAVACLGPATADAARALGMPVDIIAEEHTIAGLLEALVKWRQHS